MPTPHWYLMVIGVSPVRRGQGVGRALIQPILDRADADGVPSYLETTQVGNVGYYQSLGFQVLVHTIDPKSRLNTWTFRREANMGG